MEIGNQTSQSIRDSIGPTFKFSIEGLVTSRVKSSIWFSASTSTIAPIAPLIPIRFIRIITQKYITWK